jgi:hypothetical protein
MRSGVESPSVEVRSAVGVLTAVLGAETKVRSFRTLCQQLRHIPLKKLQISTFLFDPDIVESETVVVAVPKHRSPLI